MYSELNIVIYIVLIIILISIMFFIYKNNDQAERFDTHVESNMMIKNTNIRCLLLLFKEDSSGHKFLSAYINRDKNPDSLYNNTLIQTTSLDLDTGEWDTVCKEKEPFPNGDIEYLTWHRDEKLKNTDTINNYNYSKRLMCIVKEIITDKNTQKKIPTYSIHIKKDTDLASDWIPYMPDGKTKISNKFIYFIIYDLRNNLIGINYKNNQIYKLNEKKCIWEGPINVSQNAKIKKIIFDWDRKMLGLDTNNILWKKKSLDWTTSIWQKHNSSKTNFIGTTEETINISDLLHDTDGKLIAVSDKYKLVKQQNYNYNSYFIKYNTNNNLLSETEESNFYDTFPSLEHHNLSYLDRTERSLMLSSDVFMNKTGIDTSHYDHIDLIINNETTPNDIINKKNNLIQKLNFMIEFKRKFVNKCKNNRNTNTFFETNNNISDQIDSLMDTMSEKGYKNV